MNWEQQEPFLRKICLEPRDVNPRLIFADFLEENNDPVRAEFIRLGCEEKPKGKCTKNTPACHPAYYGVLNYEDLCTHCQACRRYKINGDRYALIHRTMTLRWKEECGLGGMISSNDQDDGTELQLYQCTWINGFIEQVVCNGTWGDFLRDAPVIFKKNPIRSFQMGEADASIAAMMPPYGWPKNIKFIGWCADEGRRHNDTDDVKSNHCLQNWIPWEIAKDFPPHTHTDPPSRRRLTTRYYWHFEGPKATEDACKFLNTELVRYGLRQAWGVTANGNP